MGWWDDGIPRWVGPQPGRRCEEVFLLGLSSWLTNLRGFFSASLFLQAWKFLLWSLTRTVVQHKRLPLIKTSPAARGSKITTDGLCLLKNFPWSVGSQTKHKVWESLRFTVLQLYFRKYQNLKTMILPCCFSLFWLVFVKLRTKTTLQVAWKWKGTIVVIISLWNKRNQVAESCFFFPFGHTFASKEYVHKRIRCFS